MASRMSADQPSLRVSKLPPFAGTTDEALREQLRALPSHELTHEYPTAESDRRPVVTTFSAAHDETSVAVLFRVAEHYVRARATADQQPVYEDSCVELFVKANDAPDYVNFEFNCIGTCLSARGPDRAHRTPLARELLESIRRAPSMDRSAPIPEPVEAKGAWELLVVIPAHCWCAGEGGGKLSVLSQTVGFTCNLYKCGDKLTKPHWYSFFAIQTDKPDFHRPEYFRPLLFEP